ncbi:histidine phosphatase family protein [Streptomyces sp. PLK6-54]|uniref:Histidine phosphatase family protein n=1 Tax=Actinacidiphila acidipaludis TaxID=2873382 RepID=A0ABS7QFZ9_9ACTN|nr:histidine phosphatase family protein [Streptomyces acidipaludis]
MGFRCSLRRVTAVRHGQSSANVVFARAVRTGDTAEAVPEPCDAVVPLSPLGVAQARAAGQWLGDLYGVDRPTVVVCSPYMRAVQTWEVMAGAAGKLGVVPAEALLDERLRDREMGVLELMTPPAMRAHAPEEAERRERVGEWFYRPPGGESMADVLLRVRDFLNEVSVNAPGEHLLIVAHDAVVLAVRQILAGIGAPVPGLLPIPNASVSRWDSDGSLMRMTEFGAIDHLSHL